MFDPIKLAKQIEEALEYDGDAEEVLYSNSEVDSGFALMKAYLELYKLHLKNRELIKTLLKGKNND